MLDTQYNCVLYCFHVIGLSPCPTTSTSSPTATAPRHPLPPSPTRRQAHPPHHPRQPLQTAPPRSSTASRGRHPAALRCLVQLSGGALFSTGRVRPQPGRQAGQAADRLRPALRGRRLARGRRCVRRQHGGSEHGRGASEEGPAALRLLHPVPYRIHRNLEFPGHLRRAAIPQLHQLHHLFPKLLRIRLHIDFLAHRSGPTYPRLSSEQPLPIQAILGVHENRATSIPAKSTVHAVLDRHGLVRRARQRRKAPPGPQYAMPRGALHPGSEGLSRPAGAGLPLPRQGGSRDGLRAHLHAPQENQHLNRDGRPAARHQGGRRRHLARQFHAP